jgi:hypothetical protein
MQLAMACTKNLPVEPFYIGIKTAGTNKPPAPVERRCNFL